MAIQFHDVRDEPYGAFSNLSKHPFTLDGVWYPTAEHAFQAAKFVGLPQAETIRRLRGGKDAARMGRDCRSLVRGDWDAVKEVELKRILLAKFTAHASVRNLLISTGVEAIEFASPMDRYWGTGRDGTGANRFGELLVQLRATLDALQETLAPLPDFPSVPEAEGVEDQGTDVG